MQKIFLACALAFFTTTGYAFAQNTQQSGSSDFRAQMEQARDNAKTASFQALSSDHQAKVQAIVDGFNNGSLDADTAASQIDAVLTPAESTAVLAQEQKMRDAMRAAFAKSGMGGGGTGGGMGRRGGMGGSGQRPKPDAGRFLLMVSASPDKLRDTMGGSH